MFHRLVLFSFVLVLSGVASADSIEISARVVSIDAPGVLELETRTKKRFWVSLEYVDRPAANATQCKSTKDPVAQRVCALMSDYVEGAWVLAHVSSQPLNGPWGAVYEGTVYYNGVDVAQAVVDAGEMRLDHSAAPPNYLTTVEDEARCDGRGTWAHWATDPINRARCDK